MSASPKWPALPVTRIFISIFAFTISASDAKVGDDISRGYRPQTATRSQIAMPQMFEMSRAADDYSILAFSRLLHEGGPTFSQPQEYP
jgi:hypothetical protein